MNHVRKCIDVSAAGNRGLGSISCVFEVYLRTSHQTVTLQYRAATLFLAAAMTAVFSMTVSPVFGFTLGRGQINLIPGQVLRDIGSNPLNFLGTF